MKETKIYKDITWGKILSKSRQQYTFYPLYDWSYSDVWKAIHDNEWKYNTYYDTDYMHGTHPRQMRVSNLHHEKAVASLFKIQEYEPKTYERLAERLTGVDMAGKLGADQFFVHELPPAFHNWKEYRDYLVIHLTNKEHTPIFLKRYKEMDRLYQFYHDKDALYRAQIQGILTNDVEFVKLASWERAPDHAIYRQYVSGKKTWDQVPRKYRKKEWKDHYGELRKTANR